jgi:hypothetical protein
LRNSEAAVDHEPRELRAGRAAIAIVRSTRNAVLLPPRVQRWAVALMTLCGLCLLRSAHAQEVQQIPLGRATTSANGFAPDAQLVGGLGIGFGHGLGNPFLGRARLGALYAHEPWIANLGLSLELGALAQRGIGGEFELNSWGGLFAGVGLARVEGNEWMGHLSVGYTNFGLEFQHRFSQARPSYALLFEVRVPIGIWWFLVGRRSAETKQASSVGGAPAPRVMRIPPPPTAPMLPPSAAVDAATGDARLDASGPQSATSSSNAVPASAAPSDAAAIPPSSAAPLDAESPQGTDSSDTSHPNPRAAAPEIAAQAQLDAAASDDAKVERALAEARVHSERAEYALAELALARAYARRADPMFLLQLADAQEKQGKLALALTELQRFLKTASEPNASLQKPTAQARIAAIEPRLSHLRLQLLHARGDEHVDLDEVVQPTAGLGYDLPLDPGSHVLRVSRGQIQLRRREFAAAPGELVRIDIDLDQRAAP